MSNIVYVAVYGSLRTGMENARVNNRAGAVSLGEGFTKDNASLFRYSAAYFPMVSLSDKEADKPVRIEVFKTTQEGLEGPYDSLEGYPMFYNRTQIPVVLDSGEELSAWIYHIEETSSRGDKVESGDWKQYRS